MSVNGGGSVLNNFREKKNYKKLFNTTFKSSKDETKHDIHLDVMS